MNTTPQKQVLVIATGNPGKLKEFVHILGTDSFEFKTLQDIGFTDEIIENAPSFAGNAALKAQAVGDWVSTRFPSYCVLADDSGLEVFALNGAPGVRTARFAGEKATDEQNYRKLLSDLQGHLDRSARFVCSLCYWHPKQSLQIFEGECQGTIAEEPLGDQGFGYDPVFRPSQGNGRTFAQMGLSEKKSLSHRGEAIKKLQLFFEHSSPQKN